MAATQYFSAWKCGEDNVHEVQSESQNGEEREFKSLNVVNVVVGPKWAGQSI